MVQGQHFLNKRDELDISISCYKHLKTVRCLLFLSYISSDSLVWFQIYHCFLTPTSSLIINRRLSRTQTSVLRQYSLQWNANTFLHLKEGLVYCLRIKRICFLFLVFKFILLKNIVYNYFWYTAVIQLYIYIYIYMYIIIIFVVFATMFYCRISNIVLWAIVGPCCLSILYLILCIC